MVESACGASRPDRTGNLRYFTPALCLLSLGGTGGAERSRTAGLRSARPTLFLLSYSPTSRERASRTRCFSAPNRARSPCRSSPMSPPTTGDRPRRAGFLMPSTVEFSTTSTAGRNRGCAYGWQEPDPHLTALDAAALPVELRPYVLAGNEDAALSGGPGAASVSWCCASRATALGWASRRTG